MSISQSMSIKTKNGEAAVLSFTAEGMQQDSQVITLLDAQGEPAVVITIAEGTTHRIL
jgi:hypothetical protein